MQRRKKETGRESEVRPFPSAVPHLFIQSSFKRNQKLFYDTNTPTSVDYDL